VTLSGWTQGAIETKDLTSWVFSSAPPDGAQEFVIRAAPTHEVSAGPDPKEGTAPTGPSLGCRLRNDEGSNVPCFFCLEPQHRHDQGRPRVIHG